MLSLNAKNRRSWEFSVCDQSRSVARFDVSSSSKMTFLTVEGEKYAVRRESWMRSDFILDAVAGPELARATKPSVFRRRFVIKQAERLYTLRAASLFTDDVVLFDGSQKVGSISREGPFTRSATIDLPEYMPLPVRVFIVWLAAVLWKNASDAVMPA